MKIRIKPKKLILPVLNALAVAGIIFTTIAGHSAARSQSYNFAYERWKGISEEDFGQASCFFSDEAKLSTKSIRSLRGQVIKCLKDAACDIEKEEPFADAYSAIVGEAKVKCDISRSSKAQITAVGGNFFLFHDFDLISGAYFSEKDTMQDGAVIDKSLAWALYGSTDIVGMYIYIDGVKCYISGVIEDPTDKVEKKCAGKMPKAYVTYDTASSMKKYASSGDPMSGLADFDKITCYECILPEPVEKLTINSVKSIFADTYGENVSIVDNMRRFTPKTRAKAFRKLSESVIRNDGIRLPYWENTSRMYEFKATVLYGLRRYMFIIPILTLLWLAFRGIVAYNRNKAKLKQRIINFADKKLHKRRADVSTSEKGITS